MEIAPIDALERAVGGRKAVKVEGLRAMTGLYPLQSVNPPVSLSETVRASGDASAWDSYPDDHATGKRGNCKKHEETNSFLDEDYVMREAAVQEVGGTSQCRTEGDKGRAVEVGAVQCLRWSLESALRNDCDEGFQRDSSLGGDRRREVEVGVAPSSRLSFRLDLKLENLESQDLGSQDVVSWYLRSEGKRVTVDEHSHVYPKVLVDRTSSSREGGDWRESSGIADASGERCQGGLEDMEGDELQMRKTKVGKAVSSEDNHGTAAMALTRANSCKLPDHLIESVIARLPVQSTFRFRCVSRAWREMIHSPTFLRAYSEAPIRRTIWFLVRTLGRFGPPNVALFDPECNKWLCISLPSPLRDINWHPTAADGGLVCYFGFENRSRTLFVVNPLTKSLRKLPPVHRTSSHISVLKMAMEDRSRSAYKVFVAGMLHGESDNVGDLSMEVYDSITNCWTTGGIIPAKYPKRRAVYADGVLYVRCYDQKTLLLTYDIHTQIWHRIHAPLPQSLDYEELVHYNGHILLIGLLAENYNIESVCIWELQQQHGLPNVSWKQVESMPRHLFENFFRDREYFECQKGDRVAMKCCQYGDLILCFASNHCNRGPVKVVGFDLGLKAWRLLPDMFKGKECKTYKLFEGIIYESRVDVFA